LCQGNVSPKKEELLREEPKVEPPIFRADHRFLFLIRENQTASILFVERVMKPKQYYPGIEVDEY
jgi:serine protease inhibitor